MVVIVLTITQQGLSMPSRGVLWPSCGCFVVLTTRLPEIPGLFPI